MGWRNTWLIYGPASRLSTQPTGPPALETEADASRPTEPAGASPGPPRPAGGSASPRPAFLGSAMPPPHWREAPRAQPQEQGTGAVASMPRPATEEERAS
eukprot:2102234-Heterocapsa_arctica.AAC.1